MAEIAEVTTATKAHHGVSKGYISWLNQEDGTYSEPEPLPGLIGITHSPTGESQTRYADNCAYMVVPAGTGGEGEITLSGISEATKNKMFGRKHNATNGLSYSSSEVSPCPFAFMWQEETDAGPIRHCLLNCTASTPEDEYATDEEEIQFRDLVIPIKTATVVDGDENVLDTEAWKGKGDNIAYDKFFTKVILPSDSTLVAG